LNIDSKISSLPIERYIIEPFCYCTFLRNFNKQYLTLAKFNTNDELFICNQNIKFQLNSLRQTIVTVAAKSPQFQVFVSDVDLQRRETEVFWGDLTKTAVLWLTLTDLTDIWYFDCQ